MKNMEYFNNIAYKWDEICTHDKFKLKKIIDLSSIKKNSKILDVGTGTGILIKYLLATNPRKITAIDISKNMIKLAKQKHNDRRVDFVVNDIMEFYQTDFDYIFLYSVYPHLQNKDILFKHLSKLLKEYGKVIVAHSSSRKEINDVHSKLNKFKDHILQPAVETVKHMSNYFAVDRVIDNDEMYYISATKEI